MHWGSGNGNFSTLTIERVFWGSATDETTRVACQKKSCDNFELEEMIVQMHGFINMLVSDSFWPLGCWLVQQGGGASSIGSIGPFNRSCRRPVEVFPKMGHSFPSNGPLVHSCVAYPSWMTRRRRKNLSTEISLLFLGCRYITFLPIPQVPPFSPTHCQGCQGASGEVADWAVSCSSDTCSPREATFPSS